MNHRGVHPVVLLLCASACSFVACSAPPPGHAPARPATARNLVVVTIDTLRADHVGAYGYAAARTATLDRLGREGVRFDRAFAPAPITLTSHASLLTGRYPPGHGARDNGVAVAPAVPTLAATLRNRGYATAAFVAAFPLDRRFGLARGFDVYNDLMPRGTDGRLANERPARDVVNEAITWLAARGSGPPPFFLWVHLFEPHAPYGDPVRAHGRPAIERYDEEIATADREVGRLLEALGPAIDETLVVAASDHGEAFGEHGEIGHSLFVYDTTLRVALIMRGPGVPAGRVVGDPVSLVDIAPTVLPLVGLSCGARLQSCGPFDPDGIDLRPAFTGQRLPARELYAESFAPLFEFGWSPLRSIRDGRWKAIAAPRPELYDIDRDAGETRDFAGASESPARGARTAAVHPDLVRLLARIDRYSGPDVPAPAARAPVDAAARLGALGYIQGGPATVGVRPDPKDRRDLAARIARVTSGEVQGDDLVATIRSVLAEDPHNGQMQLRLGSELVGRSQYSEAAAHFTAAIAARVPSADPYLGLAACQAATGQPTAAIATLRASQAIEAANPVVLANIGIIESGLGRTEAAVAKFRRALAIDADFHEARFNLALALARAGHRAEAAEAAEELLRRLPRNAPQRPEVERLLATIRGPR